MKFKSNYSDSPRHIEVYSIQGLDDLRSAAERVDAPPCPFCGSPAVLGLGFMYTKPGIYIQCSNPACSIMTTLYTTAYSVGLCKNLSLTECLEVAAKVWSRRQG